MSTVTPTRPQSVPPASDSQRFRSPTWRDPRFLIGAALVVVSTLIGAMLLRTPTTTPTWAAAHDIPAGAIVRTSDLVVVKVNIPGTTYATATSTIAGQRLNRRIAAGELIPKAALGAAVVGDMRSIAVPVEDQHSPPSLVAGNYVDVWVTPHGIGGTLGMPFLALSAVPVASVNRDSMGGAAAGGTVVLDVKPTQAEELIAGLRRGVIDLVRVPGGAS